jgi:hypothetical protein
MVATVPGGMMHPPGGGMGPVPGPPHLQRRPLLLQVRSSEFVRQCENWTLLPQDNRNIMKWRHAISMSLGMIYLFLYVQNRM